MSRARTLSPSFFTDERVVSVSPFARLLFQGLWCEADREGRLEDRPLGLKMRLFPADQVDVSALLDELVQAGLVQRYAVGGRGYLLVPNFAKHQHPHPKEVASRLPAPASIENNGKTGPSLLRAVESNGSPLEAAASPSAPRPACRAGSSGSSVPSGPSGSAGPSGAGTAAPVPPPPSAGQEGPPAVRPLPETDLTGVSAVELHQHLEPPDEPPEAWTAGDFWRWAQVQRRDVGKLMVQEWPKTPTLRAWWAQARAVASVPALQEAFLAFGDDPHWQTAKPPLPWASFQSQWTKYLPQGGARAAAR